jgi:hypothetical protein
VSSQVGITKQLLIMLLGKANLLIIETLDLKSKKSLTLQSTNFEYLSTLYSDY